MTLIDKAEAHDDDLIRRGDALATVQLGDTVTKIQARIAALPARGVGVKPLVWFEAELPSRGGGKYTADGYTLRRIEGLWLLDFAGNGKTAWRWVDLEAAKAAAQADYEARIFAALEPVAAPDTDLLFDAYKGLLVLHRTLDRMGLEMGSATASRIADKIVAAHPEFPARTALRHTEEPK